MKGSRQALRLVWLGCLSLGLLVLAAVPAIVQQPVGVVWEKLTHPLIWPIDLGAPEHLLQGMAAKYNQDREVRYYSEQVKEGLDDIEQRLVNGPMAVRGRVLDVGCGAGREAIALAKLGYDVVGIDIAARMVEAAQQNADEHGVSISFLVLAAHEVTPALGSFDYILTTSGFYTYVPTRRLRVRTLTALKQVLGPEGTLFLSAPWKPPAQRAGPRARAVDWLRRLRRLIPGRALTAEPGDQLIRFVSPHSDPRFPAFIHVFDSRRSIEEEIRQAGLTWAGEPIEQVMWVLRQQ